MQIKRLVVVFVVLFGFCGIVRAEHIYVAESASGADTGLDAANAHSMAWLNTSGNWGEGSGLVGAGDTVHLTGTFTSALTVAGSGAAAAQW